MWKLECLTKCTSFQKFSLLFWIAISTWTGVFIFIIYQNIKMFCNCYVESIEQSVSRANSDKWTAQKPMSTVTYCCTFDSQIFYFLLGSYQYLSLLKCKTFTIFVQVTIQRKQLISIYCIQKNLWKQKYLITAYI